MTTVLRLKVKKSAHAWLNQAAVEVNAVWNWANETRAKAARPYYGKPKYLTDYDLNKLSSGSSEMFKSIGADIIQCVVQELAARCVQARKRRLRWRKSFGSKRSLGWVPFKGVNLKVGTGSFRILGKSIRVHDFGRIAGCKLRAGCLAQDAVGDWWLCIAADREDEAPNAIKNLVGIDLGLKATATSSDGEVLEAAHFYRIAEPRIAQAQRRGHKRQAKRIHRDVANRRKDALHKFSRKIVDTYENIVVGDVSSARMARTRFAKSVLDSGWSMLRTQLQYKGQQAGRCVEIVNERNTTRACSACGSLSGPVGLRMLVVRAWRCSECGAEHDRDVNAARNIAMLGSSYRPPSAGTSACAWVSDSRRMRSNRDSQCAN